ncbi:ethanolamine ammonia-lyase subunit EutC [Rhodopseudomonas sp. P2A-2r]|uniref:ethanolamine ammonia-lyase subunit EutC n=1 Tax=Rhodopseudomonas sp. P2A-2r TaxID=2991972 RepID=UPI0029FF4938|nr:ethanolamine ammonia-lyase subunit EutC [Rhodopseudomonas sp. P2A-2r]
MPTRAAQSFLLDHARARQAVWSRVDWASVEAGLNDLGLGIVEVASQAGDRATYVRRPDLGRMLAAEAAERLTGMRPDCDVAIILADGLSASAIDINAVPLTKAIVARLSERQLAIAPIVLASQARVAIGDPIAATMRAKVSITVIGERPGLSAADSLGIYLTHAPKSGTPDSKRNCISNVRDGGLAIADAADMATSLVVNMLKVGISGVGLKAALDSLPHPGSDNR